MEEIEALPGLVEDSEELAGMGQEGDRLEILWGPGYGGRYDYLVFKGDGFRQFFALLPNAEKTELAMIDKRKELKSFDPEEGFRRIGILISRPGKHREPESHHVMY